MNRVIKFRVWNKFDKMWITHSVIVTAEGIVKLLAIDEKNNFHCFSIKQEDVAIQQFTGLKDKNGKEIYEGDIVKFKAKAHGHSGMDFEIQIDPLIGLKFICNNEHFHHLVREFPEKFEIIGNIFENLELLEK